VIDALSCRQFALGDPEPLQGLAQELGASGSLASFCSPGLRCGQKGPEFMASLRNGAMAKASRLNAVISFKEWNQDFAEPGAQAVGQRLLEKEISELDREFPDCRGLLSDYLWRIDQGERGLAC
jgi:hypothetical protein